MPNLVPPPPWFSRIGINSILRKRCVAIDSNTLIKYFEDRIPDSELRFVFESPPSELVLVMGRQVIDETLNSAIGRPGRRWQSASALCTSGKLMLLGTTGLPPLELARYRRVREILQVCISKEDSAVVAGGLAYRLALFTRESRLRRGVRLALANRQVATFLRDNGLPGDYDAIVANG